MIFDFFLEYSFTDDNPSHEKKTRFKGREHYAQIRGEENTVEFANGYCTTLNRRAFSDCFHSDEGRYLWIFGYVYTNDVYARKTGVAPHLVKAPELHDLMTRHPLEWHGLVKGSYVVVMLDERQRSVSAWTDYLNVLPLYFAFDGERLIISSVTALILERDWVDKTPDKLALAMQHLFDYMLGEHYFTQGVRRMENARCYRFERGSLEREVFWDVERLYHGKLLPKSSSLNLLGKKLKENVNLYASFADPLLVSLTGGFDGRTNVAMLDRDPASFRCYSYGMPGSRQLDVPASLSRRLGISYEPVFLEEAFLKEYDHYSRLATWFSNGTAPIGFANIPFAFDRLSSYSDTVLTGLFGSEILRPLHNNQIQVNDQSFEIFLGEDFKAGVERAISNLDGHVYSDFDLREATDGMVRYFQENYFEKYGSYDPVTRFFFFIIQEGVRKYFSQEISIERAFVTTKFPYFDIDFVKMIYQTPWAGMYNGFLGGSRFKRRKGQLLYAHIMKKYRPAALRVPVDRGYKPGALLYPFPFNYMVIAAGFIRAKRRMRQLGGDDTFNTELWADQLLKEIAGQQNPFVDIRLSDTQYALSMRSKATGRYLTYRHFSAINQFFCLFGE